MMKKVEFCDLKKGQLLVVNNEAWFQLYLNGQVESDHIRDLVLNLKPSQIIMYLKNDWIEDVECNLYFLVESKLYVKRFVGSTREEVIWFINDFLKSTHNPIS